MTVDVVTLVGSVAALAVLIPLLMVVLISRL